MGKHLHLTPFFFEDYLMPEGFLPRDMAAHACFYFYVLAEKAKQQVGKSIDNQRVLENEQWLSTHYEQQRRTVALMYNLESPGDIDRYWSAVKLQARALGLPEPSDDYMQMCLIHNVNGKDLRS